MRYNEPTVYAVKHKDYDTRMKSRSGGIFTAVSDEIFKNGGVVYGCALNDEVEAIHIRASSSEERNKMRGSKYVQSNMGNCFNSVKEDLDNGLPVLFSGTSCQVGGLKSFLGRDYSNLFCMDLICRGVPSPLVWKKYIEYQENRNKAKCVGADFRNKIDFGWNSHIETLWFDNGKTVNSNIYTNLFYKNALLRPSCFKCPYKSIMHPGDITIGDYWGIGKAAPELHDNKGVSLVLINNDKGNEMFNAVKPSVEFRKTLLEDSMQPALSAPESPPVNRAVFWKDFTQKPFSYCANKYGGNSVLYKTLHKMWMLIPENIRGNIKTIIKKVLKK